MKKILLLLSCLGLLSGCAQNLSSRDMMPMADTYLRIYTNKALAHAITLGNVSVFPDAGGSVAPVKPEAFAEAIKMALLASGYAAHDEDTAKYKLDAYMLQLDYPIFGFSMTATCEARYQITDIDTGDTIFEQTIKIPYTADFGESFDGHQRVKIAMGRAIRENITHMIRLLSPEELATFSNAPAKKPKKSGKGDKK